MVSNVRLPRRERHATPQRLTAEPANLRRGVALESHGSLAGQRGEQRRLGAGERVAPQLVPGVGHLRDLLDDVRRLHLVGELLDDDVGERDAELDQSVAVRLEHRAELSSTELARGFTLQALDLGERVERVHRLGSRRRRLRPHASLAADGPAEPRPNRGLGGDLRGGDVHEGADDGGDVRVARLVAHVNLGDSLGAHVGNRLRHLGAAVRPERRAQVPGVGSVGGEEVADALLAVVSVLRAVEGSELAGEAQGPVGLAALLNLGELLVEAKREASLDVAENLLGGRILALVGQAGEKGEILLGRCVALEDLRRRVDLLHHLLATLRETRESPVPLHNLVDDVAPVHPALENRAVGVARRRPGVVAAAPHQGFDHVPHVLRDVGDLEAVLVHRLQERHNRRGDGCDFILGELALRADEVLASPVPLEVHVVGPSGEKEVAAVGWHVADRVQAHEPVEDPLSLRLGILGLAPVPRVQLHALGPVGGANFVVLRGEHLLLHDGRLESRLPAAGDAAAALLLLGLLRLLRLGFGFGLGVERLVALPSERIGVRLLVVLVVLVILVIVLVFVLLLGAGSMPHGEELVQLAEISEDVHRVLQLLRPDAGDVGLDLATLGLALLALDEVRELVLGVVVGRDEVPLGRRARFEDLLVVLEIFQLLSRLRLVGLLVVGLAEEVLLEVIGGLWLSFLGIRRLLQPLLLELALEAGDLVVLQEIVIFLVELELLAPLSLLGRLVVGVVVGVVVVFLDDRGAIAPAPHHRAIVVGVRVAEAEVRG